MSAKKTIIIASIITASVGSIAFYFLYWRKRSGVSESDKVMLEQATTIELNTLPLEPLPQDVQSDIRDEYGDRYLNPSTVQGPVKII